MDDKKHNSHPEHPPTQAYVRESHDSALGRQGADYDGAQKAFGPWGSSGEAGRPRKEDRRIRDGFPTMAQGAGASTALRERGFEKVAGLWLPSRAVAESWARVVAQEPRLDLSNAVVGPEGAERQGECDWKIFVEIYCDDYHVERFHPGLASLADCGQLRWIWDEHAQVQVVGSASAAGGGSPAHKAFVEHARTALGTDTVGAVWALIYPSTMIEWLAGGVALSTLEPNGAGSCVNRVAFAYPEELLKRCPGFAAAHQAAYWETAREDDEIAGRIQAGRDALAAAGRDERGPAHPHLEAGVVEFHRWLARAPWRGARDKAKFQVRS